MEEKEQKLLDVIKALRPEGVTFDDLLDGVDSEDDTHPTIFEKEG